MAAWRRVLGTAASAVDHAFAVAMHVHGSRERAHAESLSHDERLEALAAVHRAYGDASLLGDPTLYFPAPPAIAPVLRPVRRDASAGVEVVDATWTSTFEPFLGELREKYLARVENRTARARLFLGREANRAAVIAVHGYMGGHWLLEETQWPIAWLARRGLDVALPLLPFHALRAGPVRGAPPFPSSDPRLTNEGFRQAVADIAALARWLRERGASHVGVMGMSLGGYTTALLATVSREIDFAMPMIPLASIADFAREQGRLGGGAEADVQHAALEQANWVVSPLARPLLVPRERTLVVAAEHDRITPRSHAQRIARHFACEMVLLSGGHLLQLDRGAAFRAFAAMLEREGIIGVRPRR